jgi:TolB-like protein/AraC-like DNA-binding protein/Tfp pilus assembly protein PilF
MPITDKSIAVLPFVNRSGDPENAYFSDGITEEIINALAALPGLKVIARTSSFAFKDRNEDVRTIGRQLGVRTLLEGSVRKARNRVRITAQLISTADGAHLWAKNFDRELDDLFALQDEISLLIADQIREHFGHIELPNFLPSGPTPDQAAYDLRLKGSYHLKRKGFEDIKKALQFFREAIQLDPAYAEAYAQLGEAYLHAAGFGLISNPEAHRRARQAAERAIELDPHNALGYKVLAYVNLFYDWSWDAAIAAYEQAIANGLPDQNEFITYYQIFIEEDFDRAIAVAKKATETDPLHVISHWQLGLTYYFARRFEAAIDAFDAALTIDPAFGEALRFRGLVQGYLGRYEAALIDINKALELTSGQGLANIDKLVVKILMGKTAEVATAIPRTDLPDASDPAILYALLNQPDEALEWLEKAYAERSVMLVTLKNFWVWDNLRTDARFQAIYDRMQFPPSTVRSPQLAPVAAEAVRPAESSLLAPEEVAHYRQQLDRLIQDEEVFTDPALSLRQLAARIELHPNKLSWLLNEHLGQNFNEFVNSFRLATFKEKALDPANSHLTLLGLAYESGFNSKSVFNAFFKKQEGVTPRAWVKKRGGGG